MSEWRHWVDGSVHAWLRCAQWKYAGAYIYFRLCERATVVNKVSWDLQEETMTNPNDTNTENDEKAQQVYAESQMPITPKIPIFKRNVCANDLRSDL